MNVEIITNPLTLDLYGFSGIAVNQAYSETAFGLMNKMWKEVKSNNLKNKGLNIWVYEPGNSVFAGVELNEPPAIQTGLEHKIITLEKYAYFKHIGPYSLIKQSGLNMQDELKRKGFETIL